MTLQGFISDDFIISFHCVQGVEWMADKPRELKVLFGNTSLRLSEEEGKLFYEQFKYFLGHRNYSERINALQELKEVSQYSKLFK